MQLNSVLLKRQRQTHFNLCVLHKKLIVSGLAANIYYEWKSMIVHIWTCIYTYWYPQNMRKVTWYSVTLPTVWIFHFCSIFNAVVIIANTRKHLRFNRGQKRFFSLRAAENCPCDLCENKFAQLTSTPPQSLVGRLKENLEKMTEERNQRIAAENREKDQNKRMQRQIRDIKEEMGELSKKEAEASRKKHELVRPLGAGRLDTIHWC